MQAISKSIHRTAAVSETLTKAERSERMSHVRGFGNRSTEWRLRATLIRVGVSGWRMHVRALPGRPDFVFTAAKLAVFVDGCFWHGCSRCYRRPKTRKGFWDAKLAENTARDHRNHARLRRMGWHVVRLWEHDLVKPRIAVRRIMRVLGKSGSAEAS